VYSHAARPGDLHLTHGTADGRKIPVLQLLGADRQWPPLRAPHRQLSGEAVLLPRLRTPRPGVGDAAVGLRVPLTMGGLPFGLGTCAER
jgi:hypothetical protein